MTKSKNNTVQRGRFLWNSILLLSTGASAAFILRELREQAKTLELLAEEQRLLREQVRTLLSSTERLSSAVDALSAHAFSTLPPPTATAREPQTAETAPLHKTGATKSGLAKAGTTRATSTKATTAKPVRTKKKRASGSESATGASSQETPPTGDSI